MLHALALLIGLFTSIAGFGAYHHSPAPIMHPMDVTGGPTG